MVRRTVRGTPFHQEKDRDLGPRPPNQSQADTRPLSFRLWESRLHRLPQRGQHNLNFRARAKDPRVRRCPVIFSPPTPTKRSTSTKTRSSKKSQMGLSNDRTGASGSEGTRGAQDEVWRANSAAYMSTRLLETPSDDSKDLLDRGRLDSVPGYLHGDGQLLHSLYPTQKYSCSRMHPTTASEHTSTWNRTGEHTPYGSSVEKRWSTIEKECFAIFQALREFEYLLRDRIPPLHGPSQSCLPRESGRE